ncbi:MAG: calcium/sodium antiporter [Pseudomonadales bacterium]
MLVLSGALLLGFLVLFKSADWFVIGSVATARNLDVSPMAIGLTVVALGTSAPEIFVAIASSLRGQPEIAVGNAIGSNSANIGLVLGVTALIAPLPFRAEIIKNDLPVLIFVTLCAGATLIDYQLGIWDGLLLALALALFLFRLTLPPDKPLGPDGIDYVAEISELGEIPGMATPRALMLLAIALVLLLLSSELLVWAASRIAINLGIGELVIGLTVIAVGTSLPELVVSITSALKKQPDLAIGNIVGSNIFNLLAVLTIPAVMAPAEFSAEILWRDYGVMLLLTVLLVTFAYSGSGQGRVGRVKGSVLVVLWVGYLLHLYHASPGNQA